MREFCWLSWKMIRILASAFSLANIHFEHTGGTDKILGAQRDLTAIAKELCLTNKRKGFFKW
jgi:hypothetical protein